MEQKKEYNITKLAEKNAIERLIKEDPNVYERTAREMYARRKFPDGGIKFNQYREEELKKLQQKTEIQKQLEEKQKTIDELTDTLKRLQAEFENYKKRVDKEKEEFTKYSAALTVGKLLPVLDSFEIALKSTNDKEKFVQGIKMIHAQLISTLESIGLRPIKADGEQFDPYKHEVLLKEESDKPEGTILEELQRGYMFQDRVLRFSKVKISGK